MKPVTVEMTARFPDPPVGVLTVRLVFDPARPLEVRATLRKGQESGDWNWSRDVLAEALDGPAGMGAVTMWPDGDEIRVRLQGLDSDDEFCAVTLALPRRDVERFVGRTARVVPRGREPQHDWDGDLAQLIGGA